MMLRFYDLNLALRRQNYFLKRSRRLLLSAPRLSLMVCLSKISFFFVYPKVSLKTDKRENSSLLRTDA